MASRRKRAKGKAFNIANKLFPFVKAATPIVAFLEQISSKDRQTLGSTFSQASTGTQFKIMANIVLGRLAGITLFHKLSDGTVLPTAPQTLNPAGIVNKWTTAGLVGIGYGILGKAINNISRNMGLGSVVPAVSKIKSIGKGAFIGGGVGGFFDNPENGNSSTSHTTFPSLQQAPQLQLISSRTVSGNDSTQSGMT